MSKRRRTTQSRKFSGHQYDQFNISGRIVNESRPSIQFNGAQYTESVGHDWPPPQGAGISDRGGPFLTTKQYVEVKPLHARIHGNVNIGPTGQPKMTERYSGPVFVYPSSIAPGTDAFPPNPQSSDEELDEAGATAVARCKPTNSAIDLGVMAGEILREGLPRFGPSAGWLDRTRTAKSAGSDYLNVQFGWKPLVSEINTFASEVDKTYAALQQLRRDDKRLVRRGYEFDEESETTPPVSMGGIHNVSWFPFRDPDWINGSTAGSEVIRTVETVRRRWFSGAFIYHLPDSLKGETELGDLRALIQHSLGIDLTPEVLWNLTPWSWAVDWFTNVGDVISNISDSQKYGLVMPYGYMMEHSIRKYIYEVRNFPGFKPGGRASPSACALVTETKVRRPANPFGFGLTDSSLDSGQLAILGALGLSRSG